MSKKSVSIEVIKEGEQINGHECGDNWARGNLKLDTPDNVFDFQRICRVCGKLEHVTETISTEEDFDEAFQRIYGKE